jgi:hypothetical protein
MQGLVKKSSYEENIMKKSIVLAVALLVYTFGVAFAENTFDSQLSSFRKSIIGMCAQLQAGQPKESQEQLLKEIDGIIGGWEGMSAAYKNTPPAEYAKDPAWKGYFDEALDNFKIMRQKAEAKDYMRAMQFCGQNCGLFVKIHQVNGRVTLSDKMFTVRQNVKLAMSMAKSGNWHGASQLLKRTAELFAEIDMLPVPADIDKTSYRGDVRHLRSIFNALAVVVGKKNLNDTDVQFKTFLGEFGKLYIKYI